MKKLSLFIFLWIRFVGIAFADPIKTTDKAFQDYGVLGHLFEIQEKSLYEEIMASLSLVEKNGKLKSLQDKFVEKVRSRILKPIRVKDIKRAVENREWTYDPSYIVPKDIVDHRGVAIAWAGQTVNPLDKLNWGEKLIFIDSEDEEQIKWVKTQKGRITLIAGAPLELATSLARPVFFDQAGLLCKKFGVEHVPAIIEQEGKMLKVREIKL